MFDGRKNYDRENDGTEDTRSDRALRAGLYDLPTPDVSADFDRRIQTALVRRPSWWQLFWIACQPAVPTAACTLTGMLLLLHFTQQTPAMPLTSALASARATIQNATARKVYDVPEEAIDRIDLTYASLNFLSHPLPRNTHKSG